MIGAPEKFAEIGFEKHRKPTRREQFLEDAVAATEFINKKGSRNRPLTDRAKEKNRTKSKVRAKVEHPFLILKRIFGFNKKCYCGLGKNANRLFTACGPVNLYMARRVLIRLSLGQFC